MEYILEKKKHRNEIKLDFIGELHHRAAFHVVQLIFQNIDAETFKEAENVSHLWMSAINLLNKEKLWKGFLDKKIARYPKWKYLYEINNDSNIMGFQLKQTQNDHFPEKKLLSFRDLYGKLEFALKIAKENWQLNGFARENIILAENLQGITHLISMDIYYAFYNENWNEFHVFNRENLNKKLVYKVKEDIPYITNHIQYNYRIIENFIIYPTSKCRLVFVDLTTGTHTVHFPLTENEEERFVSFMTTTKHLIAICVKTRKNDLDVALDIYQWQFQSLKSLDWKKFQTLHFNGSHEKTLHCDHRFSVIQSYIEGSSQIEVRQIQSLETKVNLHDIKIRRTICCLFVQGLIFYEENNTVRVVDVESGIMWQIWKEEQSYNQICSLTNTSETFYAFSVKTLNNPSEFDDLNVALLTLSSWNLNDVCNRKEMISRAPLNRFKTCVPRFSQIFSNDVNITFGWVNNTTIHFHKISLLPMCSNCKIIKNLLIKCPFCESVKYCSEICKALDWSATHVEHCLHFKKMKDIQQKYCKQN